MHIHGGTDTRRRQRERRRIGRFSRLGRCFVAAACAGSMASALAFDAAPDASTATRTVESAPRYTFAWPLGAAQPQPRGGISQGAPVAIERTQSAAWAALQVSGLSTGERDRRAILAMAGAWRVTFDFVEVAAFGSAAVDPKAAAPYQSWGTEKVYVDRDEPRHVSLVHILEMRIVDADGRTSDPIVTKHWRQEWDYEPTAIVEYVGRERWHRRAVNAVERRGAWRQTVLQVDESPRYASLGRWQHTAGFSTWIGGDTWRPLPRREWTVRHDYQVLVGTNRHTVTPAGWLQEENNLKAVLTPLREIDASSPYVGREYGVARYERLRDLDFAAADRYFERTRAFWTRVKDTWNADFAGQGTITLLGQVDQKAYFMPLFERAEAIHEAGTASGDDTRDDARTIRAALDAMRAPTP